MKRGGAWWASLGMMLGGAVLILLALWFSWTEMRFAAAAERTESVVVALPAGSEDDPGRTYGRIAYEHQGRRHEREMWPGSGSGTLPEDSILGDRQTVLIPPGRPGEARIASWGNRYALKVIVLMFGAILLLIGAVLYEPGRRGLGVGLDDTHGKTRQVALGFLSLGLLLFAIAAGAAWSNKAWIDRSQAAIGFAEGHGLGLRVAFTDREGRRWLARAPFLAPEFLGYRQRVGVEIRYDPAEPWNIRPWTFWEAWSTYIFLGGFALAFCAVPLLGLWMLRNIRKREAEIEASR
jgi:hypothetical protein